MYCSTFGSVFVLTYTQARGAKRALGLNGCLRANPSELFQIFNQDSRLCPKYAMLEGSGPGVF